MNMPTEIEQRLLDYMSPCGKAGIEEYYKRLEAEAIDEEIEARRLEDAEADVLRCQELRPLEDEDQGKSCDD